MSEVIVTGASGFIGKFVCAELSRRRLKARPVTRDVEGGYGHLSVSPGSFCIHLAGENDLQRVSSAPEKHLEDALRIARQLLSKGFDRLLFVSSAVVYGDTTSTARREDEEVSPLQPYGRIKRTVEEFFLSHGHPVARLSNVYGPGMSKGNVLSDILSQVPGQGAVRLRDLAPVRDYVHVSDMAVGIVDLVTSSENGIFNLGSGRGISVRELAETILKLAGEAERSLLETSPRPESSRLVLDASKAKVRLGWESRKPLLEGLSELIQTQ